MLFVTIGFSNCIESDDPTQEETLNGIWNLKNVHGGLQGINIDYSLGDVKWNFVTTNNTVVVENNIISTGPEDIFAGLDSGIYNYYIEQENDVKPYI